jgi:hypothetical protein
MSSKRNSLVLPPSLPPAARKLFDRFPLPVGCDPHSYRQHLADALATLRPKTSIEAFWVKDFVDLTLEIKRLRQIEAGLLEAQARDADHGRDVEKKHLAMVRANLAIVRWAGERGLDHRSNTPEIKAQWAKFHEEELLSNRSRGPAPSAIPADPNDLVKSFLRHSAELDRISRMIAVAEVRRRSVLQELEQYRAARRARTRRAGGSSVAFTERAVSQ